MSAGEMTYSGISGKERSSKSLKNQLSGGTESGSFNFTAEDQWLDNSGQSTAGSTAL
jgi:hypothetical protein